MDQGWCVMHAVEVMPMPADDLHESRRAVACRRSQVNATDPIKGRCDDFGTDARLGVTWS